MFLSKKLPDYMNYMFQPLGTFITILTTSLPYYPLAMLSFKLVLCPCDLGTYRVTAPRVHNEIEFPALVLNSV